jgi:methionine synthase I (cobalamin-dependent)
MYFLKNQGENSAMSCPFKELIDKNVPVIFDGAFGTQVQGSGLTAADFEGRDGCNEILNLTRPDIVLRIHREYLLAGANAIETNTFGASRPKLREKGLGDKVCEINRAGAVLARKAAEGRSCCVCGAIDRKSTRLNSSHRLTSRMPSSA